MLRRGFLVFGTAAGLLGGGASAFAQADPLPSWNDGAPKKAILDGSWSPPPVIRG